MVVGDLADVLKVKGKAQKAKVHVQLKTPEAILRVEAVDGPAGAVPFQDPSLLSGCCNRSRSGHNGRIEAAKEGLRVRPG